VSSGTTDNSQWMILGYDPRQFLAQWREAWSTLLFDRASPLRLHLDEPVRLRTGSDGDSVLVRGDEVIDAPAESARFDALLAPDDRVLTQTLRLPRSVDAAIDSVVEFELAARNPFPADDAVTGWRETQRDEKQIEIALAIASRASLASWAAAQDLNLGDRELWARVGERYVALRVSEQTAHADAYRGTLRRVALKSLAVLLLLPLCALLYLAWRHNEAEALRQALADVEARAQRAMELRSELTAANDTIRAAAELFEEHRNPHSELARLTRSLEDSAFLTHFSMRGDEVRVRGQSRDAARVMQTLAEHPAYASVSAPQAITAVGRTDLEQFYLDMQLRSREVLAQEADTQDPTSQEAPLQNVTREPGE
jgi:Tfp pilus assembly protein PilN